MRGIPSSRLFLFALVLVGLAGIAASTSSAAAQNPLPNSIPNRITTEVSNSSKASIRGSVSPKVALATDLGPTPEQTILEEMSLHFSPSPEQQAALDQLLADQQNPASPRFRQWLSPQQYAAQFGLSTSDLAKITTWLTSQGFTVTGVANGGMFVTFEGTVAQAQTAFSTSIHNLTVNGESHFANLTDPTVPTAFAAVVTAVTGLHDFRARPHLHTSIVKPEYTSSISNSHFLAPGDLYTIYDMNPLLVSFNGSGIGTGTNCKSMGAPQPACGDIAVTGAVDISPSDIANFRIASGLSSTNLPTTVHEGKDPGAASNCTPATANPCPTPNLNDLDEASIDLEWSGAMAPGASILFVNGKDVFLNSMTQAIDQKLAPIITTSYGECEAGWGSSYLNLFNTLFQQAASQGQTVLSAAGDEGATDCESQTETTATEGLSVDFPGSSPYVTSLGGTMYNEGNATGITQFWNANSSSSSNNAGSAISYIPEAAWNEVAATGLLTGGGGGVSSFFAKPAWQVETGAAGMTTSVAPDGARDVPDIALDAAVVHDPFLFCASGSCVNGFRQSNSNLTIAGGTSFDSQIFGGMLALIVQKTGSWLGNINPTLYALGNKTAYYNPTSTSVFHDVTSGNNTMPCATGSIECLSIGSIGYSTATGYDLATGWGSVDLNNLANAWNLVTPLGSGSLGSNLSSTTLTSSVSTVAAGSAATLTATVTGSAATPTGSVQFLVNNKAVGSPVTLTAVSGVMTATYAWTPGCSTLGQQSLTAVYTGDSNYQGSIGPALTVNGTGLNSSGAVVNNPLIVSVTTGSCPNFALSVAASTVTVAAGSSIPSVTITVTPQNGFTGTVVFSATVADNTGYVPGITFTPASISVPTASSTVLTLSGITASLHMPNAPGMVDRGTMMARQGTGRTSHANQSRFALGSGVTIASLLLLVLPRRRRLGGLLLVALSVALVLGATGCGGSSQAGPPATGLSPFAGKYVVTIYGTSTGTNNLPPQSISVTYQIN